MNSQNITSHDWREEKEMVAIMHGIEIELPTKWDYAMILYNRTKNQIRIYEDLLLLIYKKARKEERLKAIDEKEQLLKDLKNTPSPAINLKILQYKEQLEKEKQSLLKE